METKSTNIQFIDEDGEWSETQFDTHDDDELARLFWDFLKENRLIEINKIIADWETRVAV